MRCVLVAFLSYLANGISLGSVYAIIALGYTMVYGIAKMLNFAHGDVIMVGAYIAFCATSYLGLPSIVAILLAMAVCTILGITIEGLAAAGRSFTGCPDHRHRGQLFPPECGPADLGLRPQELSEPGGDSSAEAL